MRAFDHFLLTRFSAALYPGAPIPTAEWLWYRLDFFFDVTYPTVRAQEGAPFRWLVLFDERCPDDFRSTVADLAGDGTFLPLWTREPFRRDSYSAPIAAMSETPWLITTRLDSDDGLATDFLAAVQRQFGRQRLEFVAFTRGLQIDRSGAVYQADYVSNPFLSLVERRGGSAPLTVYAAKHATASALAPLRAVKAPPMWLQVVHDHNVSNIVNGVRTPPAALDKFPVTLPFDGDALGAAGRVREGVRLTRLWTAHPGEFVRLLEGRAARLRGTHLRPRGRLDLATRVRNLGR